MTNKIFTRIKISSLCVIILRCIPQPVNDEPHPLCRNVGHGDQCEYKFEGLDGRFGCEPLSESHSSQKAAVIVVKKQRIKLTLWTVATHRTRDR